MVDKKKYRITLGTFDLVKGLAIISIVLGHKLYYYDINPLMCFGPLVPIFLLLRYGTNALFFMISGFSFKKQSAEKLLKKSFSDLMKPYLYVMLACAVCFPLLHYAVFRWWPGALHESTRYFLAFLFGLAEDGKVILGYELYDCVATWFFLTLFLSLNILNQILRIPNEKLQGLTALGCAFAGYALSKTEFNYFCIHQALLGTGYCYLGYLVKKYNFYQNKNLPWICASLAVISVWHTFYGDFSMAYGTYKYGFLACILAGASGLLALLLCIMASRCEWKLLDPIKTIGMYSYWIICVHALETACIPWYLWSAKMANRPYLGLWLEAAITAALLTMVCVVIKHISRHKNNIRMKIMNRIEQS